jgi:hypothetical protein
MRTIYELDSERIYTGNSRQIGDREGRKRNWIHTDTPPPEGVAQWQDEYGWKALPEYPQPPVPTAGEIADRVRAERDSKLIESDWTQVLDAAVDQAAWATYRQALRDIPQQDDFPDTVVWPEQPE